jgi:hypothetical protein
MLHLCQEYVLRGFEGEREGEGSRVRGFEGENGIGGEEFTVKENRELTDRI